jgi:hypothetical protein
MCVREAAGGHLEPVRPPKEGHGRAPHGRVEGHDVHRHGAGRHRLGGVHPLGQARPAAEEGRDPMGGWRRARRGAPAPARRGGELCGAGVEGDLAGALGPLRLALLAAAAVVGPGRRGAPRLVVRVEVERRGTGHGGLWL